MTEILPTPALSVQELYQLEKAKRADRVAPAMLEAAAELKRQQELAVLARKGGRPKGPDLKFGRGKIPFQRRIEFNDDAPGRPERLHHDPPIPPRTAAAVSLPQPPQAESPMSKGIPARGFQKTCKRSGNPFVGTGANAKFCGTCDECVAAAGASAPPRKTNAKKATKKDKPEKKRTRIETGFGRQVRALKGKSEYGETIAKMLAEADVLDTRRTQLLAAVEHLELLGRPA